MQTIVQDSPLLETSTSQLDRLSTSGGNNFGRKVSDKDIDFNDRFSSGPPKLVSLIKTTIVFSCFYIFHVLCNDEI